MKTLVLAVFLSGFLSVSGADEIRVLSGGAAKSFVDPLAAQFKPHPVKIEYLPMGKLVQSLKSSLSSGVPADMVIVSQEALETLQNDKVLAPGSGKPLARVGIGIAINEKAPVPDISTPEALKRTLLAARSVVYIDPKTGTSGRHVVEVFKRLGIEKEMEAKSTLGTGGYITEPVGRGEIELGIHQISEILPVRGVRLAGPLPPELQKYTVYVGAPVPGTAKGKAVAELIAYLSSAEARARLSPAGYSPPE
jgi:molybdate transport system substrate-binding protein